MRKVTLLLILSSVLSVSLWHTTLLADNHMDQICEFEGEHPEDEFGKSMCCLDFNGDGLDDLLVGTPFYGVGGKIYFYLGGDDFGVGPSFTMTGDSDNLIDVQIRNLGDLNNDGCDDLVVPNYNYTIGSFEFWILLGGTEPDTIPDYVYLPGGEPLSMLPRFNGIGDFNGDGYDDAGTHRDNKYYILWGGDTLELELFYTLEGEEHASNVTGVGDVNNDGYDDMEVGTGYNFQYRDLLFYGSSQPDTLYDVVLADTVYANFMGGRPAGDWNNDGYDDFYSNVGPSIGLWLGDEEISTQPDIYLEHEGIGFYGEYDYGNFNNNGYSDAAFGSPGWNYCDGRVHIVLGGTTINGSTDLYIDAPEINNYFGNAIAVGDFNNDGFDDVAVGAPGTTMSPDSFPGEVYIYAGNDSLKEISVGVDDPDLPGGMTGTGLMRAYPNPFSSEIHFEINVRSLRELTIQIYNVKGQLIENVDVHDSDVTWNAGENASGSYFCKLMHKNEVLEVTKVTLVKHK